LLPEGPLIPGRASSFLPLIVCGNLATVHVPVESHYKPQWTFPHLEI